MGYVVCDECGGYYELGEGESLDDFDACQCGGKLKYAEKIHQNQEDNDKPKLICSNCMKENEEGIFCSKCGGKLIAIKKGKAVSNIGNFEEQKQIEKLSDNAFKKVKTDYDDPREPKEFIERINWLGVAVGVGFFVISVLLSISYLFSSSYRYSFYSNFVFTFTTFIIAVCVLSIASGILPAFISKSRDYDDGIINGFLVGIISSVILGIFGGIAIIFVGVIVFGILATIGGLIGIVLRRRLDKQDIYSV